MTFDQYVKGVEAVEKAAATALANADGPMKLVDLAEALGAGDDMIKHAAILTAVAKGADHVMLSLAPPKKGKKAKAEKKTATKSTAKAATGKAAAATEKKTAKKTSKKAKETAATEEKAPTGVAAIVVEVLAKASKPISKALVLKRTNKAADKEYALPSIGRALTIMASEGKVEKFGAGANTVWAIAGRFEEEED